MTHIKLCIAGIDGRMGRTILEEVKNRSEFEIVGAITDLNSPNLGKTIRDFSGEPMDVILLGPDNLKEAIKDADVYISFTTPQAEVDNLPKVAALGKKIVVGTTGLSEEQRDNIEGAVKDKVPIVISPNFGIGVNILLKLLESSQIFPEDYDFSVMELHHTGKMDAPSGTAKKLGDLISKIRGYSKVVYGREGISKRSKEELEIASLRLGGIPGIHEITIAGPYELIRIEHVAFSRSLFAQGALLAVRWIQACKKPGIYTMRDILSNIQQ
jgi:4-hydroxy-tetrahydrodipicolinate reductase